MAIAMKKYVTLEQWIKKQVFRVKKLVGRRGAPELELLAVVIVLFAPILHESLTNSNFVTNTIWFQFVIRTQRFGAVSCDKAYRYAFY